MQMKFLAIAALTLAASVAPCLSAETNMKNLDFDLSKVTRENFYDIVVPAAKAEGTVTMYNFAGSFADTWKNLTDSFTAKYGIKVVYSDVNGDQANQQLIAVQASGQDAPVDAYFAGGGSYPLLSAKGVIGKIPLTQILPNMATYDPVLAQTLFDASMAALFRSCISTRRQSAMTAPSSNRMRFPRVLTNCWPGQKAIPSAWASLCQPRADRVEVSSIPWRSII